MRTRVFIQMRGTSAELIRRLPESLAFLARVLKDMRWSEPLAKAEAEVTPSELEEILRFGRQRIKGRTILRVVHLYERHDRTELGDSPMAELYHDTGWEPPAVENMRVAFRGWWDCGVCTRVRLEQVRPLKVRPAPQFDVQVTDETQMLLASRLAPVAEHAGAEVRGLSGRSDFVQVITPDVVTLRPVFPLFQVEERCPGCGRVGYDRSDKVEGSLFPMDDDGLIVAKEWPLSAEVTDAPAARSCDPIDWRGAIIEGHHQIGVELDLERDTSWASGSPPVFLRLPLVDALLPRSNGDVAPAGPLGCPGVTTMAVVWNPKSQTTHAATDNLHRSIRPKQVDG